MKYKTIRITIEAYEALSDFAQKEMTFRDTWSTAIIAACKKRGRREP